ncbi:sugar transferase [[Phormidium] sp. LEGE 05292]|uniref:sugar transferase n=1 Tax=[Phormidium] sp. LEGE 05292 TaxID=767427 RepID=UPI001D144524|nr:sugar transferase [Phormidium sp. LEGE 05292]
MMTEVWTAQKWQDLETAYLNKRQGIRVNLVLKRLLDLAIASLGILILLPVLALIALAVRLSSPGPILFRQQRLGKLTKPFEIYKFRTMIDGAIHQGAGINTFKGDPRVTAIGRFLREYHLDELPQLFNVLRGEMSLVGPRPLLIQCLPTYTDEQKQRFLVYPGVTAWEAVQGGLFNTLEKRLTLDVWYVNNWNVWLDLVILFRTIPVVFTKEGAYPKDDVSVKLNR